MIADCWSSVGGRLRLIIDDLRLMIGADAFGGEFFIGVYQRSSAVAFALCSLWPVAKEAGFLPSQE
jgi:hypothetical protein